MNKKELAVGDSTELEIIYSTGKHRGAASKSPAINTNEGPPAKHVTIRTTVVEQPDSTYPITVNPYRLFVSRADTIEVDETKFKIKNVSDQDLDLKIVSQPYGYFGLDIPRTVKAGQTIECKLKVRPDMLDKPFEKSITLELSDAAHSRFTIPVIRRFIGAANQPKTPEAAQTPPKTGGQK